MNQVNSEMDTRISVENVGEVGRNIHFEIPRAVYEQRFDKALMETASRVRLKGFRPGHAPKAMVAKLYGGSLQRDVLGELINDAYKDAIDEHSLKVVGQPKVEIVSDEKGGDLKFTAAVDLFPEPEIRDYLGVECEALVEDLEPTEEQVTEYINNLRERLSSTEVVKDRSVSVEGDIVSFDYSVSFEGENLEHLSGQGGRIEIGKTDGVPQELIQGLTGLEIGVSKEILVKMPDTHEDEKLAGQDVSYEVKIGEILTKVLPEVDEEFVKKTGLADDMEGLVEFIKKSRRTYVVEQNQQAREGAYFNAISEKNEFQIPQVLVDEEVREMMFEIGLIDRQKKESYDVDVTPYREALSPGAQSRVHRYILLEQIIKQEDFHATDGDVSNWLDEQARKSESTRADVERKFNWPSSAPSVSKLVTRTLMTKRLLDEAKITERVKDPQEQQEESNS